MRKKESDRIGLILTKPIFVFMEYGYDQSLMTSLRPEHHLLSLDPSGSYEFLEFYLT
jgi:hypothetical protein